MFCGETINENFTLNKFDEILQQVKRVTELETFFDLIAEIFHLFLHSLDFKHEVNLILLFLEISHFNDLKQVLYLLFKLLLHLLSLLTVI